ncbi:type VII secretion protein EccB [Melissospora conviva]|uniref:type VII secretion protein EccB n=1 Tax=Melissospora conviva TaxID=3388432 RepID=UPI003C264DA3
MRTRRDQVQAYRFVTRRIVSALLSGEPETSELPMRRLGMAVFGSTMVALIVLGGVGAYGLFTSNRAPLAEGTLVIERETGAKYVYREDGKLYPTLNFASARLLAGGDAVTRTMSQASIRQVPRGHTVGIPDAPDALPEPKSLVGLPWSVCNVPDPADVARPTTAVVIHQQLSGGTALGAEAVLLSSGDNRYLVWNNLRMRVSGGDATIAALGMTSVRPLVVGEQVVNAIAAGPDLAPVQVAGAGEPSPHRVGAGTSVVGQVFRAAGQHFVLARTGLVSISEITARLLLAGGGEISDITAEQAGSLLSQERLDPEGFPQTIPQIRPVAAARAAICATYRHAGAGGVLTTTVEVFDRAPSELSPERSLQVQQTGRDAVRTVERVVVPGGHGVLARAMPGNGEGDGDAVGGTVYLITDQGVRYPLGTASGDAKAALGYGDTTPVAVPASMLALIPVGPTLDATAAMRFADPAAAPAPAQSPATGG